jgi:hypothetical protein
VTLTATINSTEFITQTTTLPAATVTTTSDGTVFVTEIQLQTTTAPPITITSNGTVFVTEVQTTPVTQTESQTLISTL